jgi:hypothetical protein
MLCTVDIRLTNVRSSNIMRLKGKQKSVNWILGPIQLKDLFNLRTKNLKFIIPLIE